MKVFSLHQIVRKLTERILALGLGVPLALALTSCSAGDRLITEPSVPVEPLEIEIARVAIASWRDLTPFSKGTVEAGQVLRERLDVGDFYSHGRHDREDFADRLIAACEDNPKLAEAAQDFLRKAQPNLAVSLMVKTEDGLFAMSNEERDRISQADEGFWAAFRAAHPKSHGIGMLSRVGLSDDRTLALISHGLSSGLLMAYHRVAIYELRDGQWVESDRRLPFRLVS